MRFYRKRWAAHAYPKSYTPCCKTIEAFFTSEICRNRCVGKCPMEDSAKELRVEFVDLLRKQVEALELEAYVGLTDEERSEYNERQERIRDLDTQMSQSSDGAV